MKLLSIILRRVVGRRNPSAQLPVKSYGVHDGRNDIPTNGSEHDRDDTSKTHFLRYENFHRENFYGYDRGECFTL